MRIRPVFIILPVLASVLVVAVTPAGASAAGPHSPARHSAGGQVPVARAGVLGTAAPGLAQGAVRHAGFIVDDLLSGDSCTTQPDNPSITSACLAVGVFADNPYVSGLLESSFNGQWGGNIFGGFQNVTEPLQVSCVPQQANIPVCLAVGLHYANPSYPVQLVAPGDANGMSPLNLANPKGTTWSVLDDVSCASSTFCLLVGSAGTTRQTAHGLRYLSHASAYRWTGSGLRHLTLPAPAGSRSAQLASVSCPSSARCVAVGNYTSSTGRSLPYSLLWTNGTWRVQATPAVRGAASTIFNAVSCATVAGCVAVGDTTGSGATVFAERYSHGRWAVLPIAAGPQSALYSVSCPTTSYCVAAGQAGTSSLIEAWNGMSWATQLVPATPAPFTTDALLHVSCLTPAICTAVGYRHNPAVSSSTRTLALGWNGSSWTVQKTINE